MDKIDIPKGAKQIISELERCRWDAYVVGGCVRDSLLGIKPHDWDACTNAKPDEIEECFSDFHIIETGLKHGTLTVIADDESFEITTFREDGQYSDSRHPDSVTFSDNLQRDLSRRDFTINAMAYNDKVGLVDPFGGRESLRKKEIKCVGNPMDRFQEDALRIMRALRFASTYGFSIHEDTSKAIHELAYKLNNIAKERIIKELSQLLLGKGVLQILLDYSDVISVIIPEFTPCIGFNQNSPYHEYTIYDHTAHAVANYTGDDLSIKLALLLHDIGKPQCYTEDERGGHFHGHGSVSHDMSSIIIRRLKFDRKTRNEALGLILHHDSTIEPNYKTVRRWLNRIGELQFRKLLEVRMADIKAHSKGTQQSRIERCLALHDILDQVVAQEQCFSMKDLAISGRDIMALGIPEGETIGKILNHILDLVINGELPNEKDPQIQAVKEYMEKRSSI